MEKGLDLPRKYLNDPRPSATAIDSAWRRVLAAQDTLLTVMELQSFGLLPTSAYREVRQEILARERDAMDLTKQWWRGVPSKYRRYLPAPLREDFS